LQGKNFAKIAFALKDTFLKNKTQVTLKTNHQ